MKLMTDTGKEKRNNLFLAAGFTVCMILIFAVLFDFYYDLNDDSSIKDILSGAYTGIPEAHDIQMLYPLSLVISLFYRMQPAVPWYAYFLCGCQFICLFLISYSVIRYFKNRWEKCFAAVCTTAVFSVLMLRELIFIQYTVTAGLLLVTALIWFGTGKGETIRDFFKHNWVSVLLALISFQLRSEMMLLLCPLCFLGAVYKWAGEKEPFSKENKKKYFGMAFLLVILMILSFAADTAAYGSGNWKTFRKFFDERTRVYDYYGVPEYNGNEDFYQSVGIDKDTYPLLVNYNFGLDPEIDAQMMGKIADYAAAHQELSVSRRLYLSVYTYVYRFLHGQELVWDLFVLSAYFILLRVAAVRRDRRLFWQSAVLFGLRTALWIFLLFRGRVPERITHPLYLMEFSVEILLLFFSANLSTWKKPVKAGILLFYGILICCAGTLTAGSTAAEYRQREEKNLEWIQFQEYCLNHQERFYLLDVYSTVPYSEKLFDRKQENFKNYDLAGGWSAKSPIAKQKLQTAGISDVGTGLLSGQIYFVTNQKIPERNPDFLIPCFKQMGQEITIEKKDSTGVFSMYRLRKL